MGAQLGSDGAMSEINMTPLIDIVLVVLIIMMVNIPIQIEEMGLKLPSQKTTVNKSNNEQLAIALYADGKMALNRRAMDRQAMLYELTRRLRSMEKKNVFVDADLSLEYGNIVDAVDLAREAGAFQVGLAKAKPDGPLPPISFQKGSGQPKGILIGAITVVTEGGDIDEVKADEAMKALVPAIQACYFKRLEVRPELTGAYQVDFAVGPQGELLEEPAIQSDQVNDLDLRDCVKAVLPKLKFLPLGRQKTAGVRVPILFSPG
ncbi:MAG: biopolymer transporter ExbD [Myxococcales bacterium]|nr:biopolymer transporter ExbD [Myxococcales bacterium]